MKKLTIIFLFILFIFSCSREAAMELKTRVDDFYNSSIESVNRVEEVYFKLLPVDVEGNPDESVRIEIKETFDNIRSSYLTFRNIYEKLPIGYLFAGSIVKKTESVLEKFLKQQINYYNQLEINDSVYFLLDHIRKENRSLDSARDDGLGEEELRILTQKQLQTSILKGMIVYELITNYNKLNLKSALDSITYYTDILSSDTFIENIDFIRKKLD